ncbi:MAG: hypothetical protein JSS83_12165 [Cyanobacteria bacterium SZAS LIN-3]|nr:hypothetical protein [Cyanobacteria bacterium SZAS LIN-3]
MKKRANWRRGIMVVPLLAVITGISAAHAAQDKTNISALKLTQTHHYWGETETIVSLQGLRINNRGRMRYSLVAKSPDWSVSVFRDDDKTYLTQPLNQFEANGIISNFVLQKQEKDTGLDRPPSTVQIDGITVKQLASKGQVFQYMPLAGIAAPQVERILFTTYKLPTNGGIPVKLIKNRKGVDWMTGLDTTGSRKTLLVTSRIEHIQVPGQIFELPGGYRRSKSMQEVLMSNASRESAGDFDEIFETGKQRKGK